MGRGPGPACRDVHMTTCKQSDTKYDLEWLRIRNGDQVRDYIRRFSEVQVNIPDITDEEVIDCFKKGLVAVGKRPPKSSVRSSTA